MLLIFLMDTVFHILLPYLIVHLVLTVKLEAPVCFIVNTNDVY